MVSLAWQKKTASSWHGRLFAVSTVRCRISWNRAEPPAVPMSGKNLMAGGLRAPGRGASVPRPSYQCTALTIFCDPHGLISQLSLVRIATAQSVVISCRRTHACAPALRPILVRQGSQSRCIVRLNCLYLGRQSYRYDADGAILPSRTLCPPLIG